MLMAFEKIKKIKEIKKIQLKTVINLKGMDLL